MSTLTVHSSKKKQVLLAVMALAFVFIGVSMLAAGTGEFSTAGAVSAYFGILFFGSCALFLVSRLLWPKPAVVINETGLLDNASGVSAGLIPWSEITRIQVMTFQSQRFLAITVADPKKYIRQTNPVKRMFMALNQSLVGTPITIPLYTLLTSEKNLLTAASNHLPSGVVDI